MNPTLIAIDGPSASGKGTIARKLAAHFGFAYLDTGLLYRAVGLKVVRAGEDPADPVVATKAAESLNPALVVSLGNDPDLRGDIASVAASKVAAVPEVRAALLRFQRDFAAHPPENKVGAVLDGRDIGTVIAPDASVKIYVTADVAARANRRFKELEARGDAIPEETVRADLEARDARDSSRAASPAKPALDAVILDTTHMTVDEAFSAALRLAEKKLGV